MNICITHDSERGNGERLANAIRDRLNEAGHTATVGHQKTLTATQALATKPDLLIVGSAVRKFSLSPVTKRWIEELGTALGDSMPRAALFVTHMMPTSAAGRWANRLRNRLVEVLDEEKVFSGFISARVVRIPGPFVDGVETAVTDEIDAVVRWATNG